MKILILIFGLLFYSISYGKVDYSLMVSNDDAVKINRHTITIQDGPYGIANVVTKYSTANKTYRSDGILLSVDQRISNTRMTGQIGVASKDKNYYLLGNVSASYKLDEHAKFSVEVFGDMVESPIALLSNINYTGLTYSGELSGDKVGLLIGSKHVYFGDSNVQRGIFGKSWIGVLPGLNAYVSVREHENSVRSMYYSSPPYYNRSSIGISGNFLLNSTAVGGFIERSSVKTDSDYEYVSTWQLRLNTKLNQHTRLILKVGRDYGFNSEFNYRYMQVQIMAKW